MKKSVKRALALVLIFAMLLFAGCGSGDAAGNLNEGGKQSDVDRYNVTIYTRDGEVMDEYTVEGWSNVCYSDGYVRIKTGNRWFTYIGVMAKIERILP